MSSAPPPPPFLSTYGGVTATEIQPQLATNAADAAANSQRSSAVSSKSSSIVIVIIIIASAIIVSASIYLLIRYLSRRFHRSFRTSSAADDVVLSSENNNIDILFFDHSHSSSAHQLLNSLPLFTFGSLNGNVAGADCAVCLSKFERQDQLRLLPLCCHAFHAECIDTWLVSNQTCPLCRSTVYPTEAEVLNKILSVSQDRENRNGNGGNGNGNGNGNSFRIEIGSISRRQGMSDSGRRSYSIGSFEYVVEDGYEVSVGSTHQRGVSDCTSVDKESVPEPPGERVAADVAAGGGGASGRNWLRDYVERVSFSLSSRTASFRGSGRFFTGSSRRSEVVVPVDDLEANRMGEEISELFRWLSGV